MSTLSATEVAFLQIAALQGVAALVWAAGSLLVAAERAALAHWAVYAGLSSATWFTLAATFRAPPLLAVLCGVCATLALQRGIRVFIGLSHDGRVAALLLALVLAAGAVGDEAAWRPVQAAVNFGVLAWLYGAMALDLRRHARDALGWRLPTLLALPLLLGAAAFLSRAARALLQPESVLAVMAADSGLNVASAIGYIVLVLLLHATLAVLVVTRLMARLQRLARRDPLTGLLNRRALLEQLDRQAVQARRATDTLAALMIDVDHFKAVNDRYGHDVGDRALVHVAQRLTQTLRPQDRLGRVGGEEFVVVLPGADLRRARAEAERLRLAVQLAPLPHGELQVPLTLSIGVAQWAGPGEDVARVLLRADAALLRAKASGRNRVEADEPSPAGTDAQAARP